MLVITVVGWEAALTCVPALLVQTTAAAANPPILYDWRPPLTRGWANRSRSVTRVRGLMNSGTNYARSLVEQVGGRYGPRRPQAHVPLGA